MRKYIALVLTLVCVLALVGCEKNDTYKIRITIPAGSTGPVKIYAQNCLQAPAE